MNTMEKTKSVQPNQFEHITVTDNKTCKIEITGIDMDSIEGCTLNVNLENSSNNTVYMYSVVSASINGVVCDPYWIAKVAPCENTVDEICFPTDKLNAAGIKVFTNIEIIFRIQDAQNWGIGFAFQKTVNIYPYGEENTNVFQRQSKATDIVLIDNTYVTVIAENTKMNIPDSYSIDLFLVNKSETEVMFQVDDAHINGYVANPLYATSVTAGKCAFSEIIWSGALLKEIGITGPNQIEEIELGFSVYDCSDWYKDDYANELILLKP